MAERFLVLLAVTALVLAAAQAWQWLRRRQASRIVAGTEAARDRPTLLYFWGDWCAPCRYQQAPIVEALGSELGDAILLRSIDVVANTDLTAHYGVLTVPTTIVVSPHGRVVARNTGVASEATLRRQLAEATAGLVMPERLAA